VDDEKGVIEVCSEMLESIGYKVKAVSSGMDAINLLKTENIKIDLVILDMVMPQMSGQDTFKKIRDLYPQMKVMVSSGYSRQAQIEEMMEKGCNGYILKPFDVATLSEKINLVFKAAEKV